MKFGRLEVDELGVLALLLAMLAGMADDAGQRPAGEATADRGQPGMCPVIVLMNAPDNETCQDCL